MTGISPTADCTTIFYHLHEQRTSVGLEILKISKDYSILDQNFCEKIKREKGNMHMDN